MTEREKLIEKLYQGQCSRTELEALLDLLQQAPSAQDEAVMELLWQQLEGAPDLEAAQADAILQKSLSKIEVAPSTADKKLSRKIRGRVLSSWRVAAAIVLLVGAAVWFWQPSPAMVALQTAYGEQKTITLPDQSQVKLNANSSIRFQKNWDKREDRQVWLEGEAYFEVRKNLEREQKFQVITKDLTVEVLGTVFNVNTRDESTVVFLEEGLVHVAVQDTKQEIAMDPGELMTYSRKTGQPVKKKIETEAPASWKDGTILLQDASLRKIVAKMEEIYGLSARVDDQTLLDQTFNFPMPVGKLETALLLLRESTGLEIDKTDDELVIRQAVDGER